MKKYLIFEKLQEDETKKMIGGFSLCLVAISNDDSFATNNCRSGNCLKNCKNKVKRRKSKSSDHNNCKAGANYVKGCKS